MRRRAFRPVLFAFESRITPTDLVPTGDPITVSFDPGSLGNTMPILVPSPTGTEYGTDGNGVIATTEVSNPNSIDT